MMTIVLSGPDNSRPQAKAALKQVGGEIIENDGHPQGHERQDGEAFITVHSRDLDGVSRAVEALGWRLRSYWNTAGEASWSKIGSTNDTSALQSELAAVKALLKAANVKGF